MLNPVVILLGYIEVLAKCCNISTLQKALDMKSVVKNIENVIDKQILQV